MNTLQQRCFNPSAQGAFSVSIAEVFQNVSASKGSMMYVSLSNAWAINTTEHVVEPHFRGKLSISGVAAAYANYQDGLLLYCFKLLFVNYITITLQKLIREMLLSNNTVNILLTIFFIHFSTFLQNN